MDDFPLIQGSEGVPLAVIADCGILNKRLGKIMIPLTKQRNSYRRNSHGENDESECYRSLFGNDVSMLELCGCTGREKWRYIEH